MNRFSATMKILFIGQCTQFGHDGIEPKDCYPQLAISAIKDQFPQLFIESNVEYLTHLKGLKALLKDRSKNFKPDIVLLNLVAAYGYSQWQGSLLQELAPEVMNTARSFIQKIDARIKGDKTFEKFFNRVRGTGIAPVATYPPLAINDYEKLVREALEAFYRISDARLIVIGPNRFNEDIKNNNSLQSPSLFSSINQMILRLSSELGFSVINIQEAFAEYKNEIFVPNKHWLNIKGHKALAGEIERMVTAQLTSPPQ